MSNFMKIGYQLWPVEGKQFLVQNPTAATNFNDFQLAVTSLVITQSFSNLVWIIHLEQQITTANFMTIC